MSRLFLFSLIVLLVSSCGGKDSPPPPVAGTLLSSSCDEYTLIEEIADGNGGSTTQTTERSEKCGWNPPERGTVIASECDGYTLIEDIADGEYGVLEVRETERSPECGWDPPEAGTKSGEAYCAAEGYDKLQDYHDGEYGIYTEVEETDSYDCGYEDPILRMIAEKESGDRFDPVRIRVEYTQFGNPIPWELEDNQPTLGIASREEDTVVIYGDGYVGEGTFTLEGEEIRYTITEEPRCSRQYNTNLDCQNYEQAFIEDDRGFIYYGEDDDRVVEWEIAFVWYTSEPIDFGPTDPTHQSVVTRYEEGSEKWKRAQAKLYNYQDAYDRSGIHVKWVLKEVVDAHFHDVGNQSALKDELDADVYISLGVTCDDACGCARPLRYFQENEKGVIPSGTSVCDWTTDLHEIGHAIGLAHGPENSYNKSSGYIWPEFGHGWNEICQQYADIMSYEPITLGHHNSLLTCGEMYADKNLPESVQNGRAGSREYADAAYAINRVRYDVSLVHCGDICKKEPEVQRMPAEDTTLPVVIDKVDDFANGREQRERFLRENPRYRNTESPTIQIHHH